MRAARDIVDAASFVVAKRVERLLFVFIAVRAVGTDVVARAVRALFVCLVVVLRCCALGARVETVPVRDVAVRASLLVAVFVDFAEDWRAMLDASRTAALAVPMPTIIRPAKSKNFFIFMSDIISKSRPAGNEYLYLNKKNPAIAGVIICWPLPGPGQGDCAQRM